MGLAELGCVRANIPTAYNGIGALHGTITKSNAAPMRYRVLLAWLLYPLVNKRGLAVYQLTKTALLCVCMVVASRLGASFTLFLALLVTLTFQYDYWDCYVELLSVLAILLGSPYLAIFTMVLWGMSRPETAFVSVPLYIASFVTGPDLLMFGALAGLFTQTLVQLVQGDAELYCERFTLRAYNIPDLKLMWRQLDTRLMLSVLLTVAMPFVLIFGRLPPMLQRTWWAPLLWLAMGWLGGRAREPRIFMPCFIWIAGLFA